MKVRLVALGCVMFLIGTGFGFYGAHAASGLKYDGFLLGKDVPKQPAEYLKGYAAGTYDTFEWATWVANEAPKYFTQEVFTKQYQCLQKIPTATEIVAWAKEFWNKQPESFAAGEILGNACAYKPSATANTMTTSGGPAHSRAGKNTLIK